MCEIHAVSSARTFASSARVHGFFWRKAKVAPALPIKEGFFAKAERRGKLFLDVVNGVDRVHDSMERILGMTVWFVIAWVIYKNADSLGLKEFYEEGKAGLQTTFEGTMTRFATMKASLYEGVSNAKLRVDGMVAAGKHAATKAADLAGGAANAASTALAAVRQVTAGGDTPACVPVDGTAVDSVPLTMHAQAPVEAFSGAAPIPAAPPATMDAVVGDTPADDLGAALAAVFVLSTHSEPQAADTAVGDSQACAMPTSSTRNADAL
jgi:hypothetical protein